MTSPPLDPREMLANLLYEADRAEDLLGAEEADHYWPSYLDRADAIIGAGWTAPSEVRPRPDVADPERREAIDARKLDHAGHTIDLGPVTVGAVPEPAAMPCPKCDGRDGTICFHCMGLRFVAVPEGGVLAGDVLDDVLFTCQECGEMTTAPVDDTIAVLREAAGGAFAVLDDGRLAAIVMKPHPHSCDCDEPHGYVPPHPVVRPLPAPTPELTEDEEG